VRRVYCYSIIFLSLSFLFPITPRICNYVISIFPLYTLHTAATQGDVLAAIPNSPSAERSVTIEPGMVYIGDDGGGGLVYTKQFTVRAIGSKNCLSLQVAGVVGTLNDNESQDYHNGFYTDKLYINGNYIDNLNNYCNQEEDQQFRIITVPLASAVLLPGSNKLTIIAAGPKGGNYDDFAVREIKLLQW
jgi:hypothetical protein